MSQSFIYAMVGIMLLPLIPAFILYKFLPSRTSVAGPFKGLSVKLTGAFGGYFLLVLVAVGIFFPLLQNNQQKRIEELERQIAAGNIPSEKWKIMGRVQSTIPEQTKVFFDDEMPAFPPTGDFELDKNCSLVDGKAKIPKWICVYNKSDGYRVINLNRMLGSPDIAEFDVRFNDSLHTISINKPIDIMSKRGDSLKYVGTFILQNPLIADKVVESQPQLVRPEMLQAAVRANPALNARAIRIDPTFGAKIIMPPGRLVRSVDSQKQIMRRPEVHR